jgi:3,4-dihydroxy 2-butanone 4-phosphate synthase / GTP cyclohydrolase II
LPKDAIERAQKAIDEIRAGKMVILVDDEDRENEGDLTMAAELVTPEAITFMATKGCGLICLTLTPERVEQLGLPMMVEDNQAPLGTAFTVSIEAANNVSTGISAPDRARTIRVAADPACGRADIVSPGHMFPLKSMPGGVLQRTGQTEGSVDLARLAGLTPAGVICEIMKSDGTMARMPDLEQFARTHNLVICSIADLIQYRLQKDRLVEKSHSTKLELGSEGNRAVFDVHVYRAIPGVRRREYVALVLGDVATEEPVLCRGHVASLVDDVFGGITDAAKPSLKRVVDAIIRRGRGIILYFASRETISTDLKSALSHPEKNGSLARDREGVLREYGIGAQILLDLGVRRLQLISSTPRRLVGFDAWGFESVEQISLEEI